MPEQTNTQTLPVKKTLPLELVPVGELLDELGRRLGCEPLSLEGYYPRWAEDVINVCADVFGVKPQDLLKESRIQSECYARMCSCAILRHRDKDKSLQEIANIYNQHHGTVINAVKRVEELANSDKDFRAKFKQICKRLAFNSLLKT